MQTAESYSHTSDTRKAIETMKRYCKAYPQTPSAHHHPQLLVRGGVWIVLLGPSISEGIAGFGYTVEAALRAFDAQYVRGSGKLSVNQTLPLWKATRAPEVSQAGHTRRVIVRCVNEQRSLTKEIEP